MQKPFLETLHVKAVPQCHVREINADGTPIMALRFVGKAYNTQTQAWDVLPEGAIVSFNPHYLKCLKEGSLLPMNIETAVKAGVAFDPSYLKG